MNAIEFEAQIHNGVVEIPTHYQAWQNKTVHVILLEPEESVPAVKTLQFTAASLNTRNYHFDRELANER